MSESLAALLFQSTARSAVLALLFVGRLSASVSELARRAGLSPRAVGNEVRHLLPTGLVLMETSGAADLVRANFKHPAAKALQALLQSPAGRPDADLEGQRTRESLVAWGAPLANVTPVAHFELNETLLKGLEEARGDGTVLRVLPVVLARYWASVKWADLREDARRRKLKAELGFLVELTGELLGRPQLGVLLVQSLVDGRRRTRRFFPQARSRFEEQLALKRSNPLAVRWGLAMNMTTESFRSTLEKHRA